MAFMIDTSSIRTHGCCGVYGDEATTKKQVHFISAEGKEEGEEEWFDGCLHPIFSATLPSEDIFGEGCSVPSSEVYEDSATLIQAVWKGRKVRRSGPLDSSSKATALRKAETTAFVPLPLTDKGKTDAANQGCCLPAMRQHIRQNSKRICLACTVVALCAMIVFLFGFLFLCCCFVIAFSVVFARRERLLGWLAGWAMAKTPKNFRWTIDRICVRPSLSFKANAWSEIVLVNWTWHNPEGFEEHDGKNAYILQIDRMTLRLRLLSIYAAVRHRRSIEVELLMVEGLRFKTQRNSNGALNLWTSLKLHDDDINVEVVVQHAQEHGGHSLKPMPAQSTAATRKAADSSKKRTAPALDPQYPTMYESMQQWLFGDDTESLQAFKQPLLPLGQPIDYPIGHPLRRPRWGVHVLFDIRRMILLDVDLWLLDLMLENSETSGDTLDDGSKLSVRTMDISRDRFESGDERRAGAEDGVHGIYLGEMVWVIIAEVLPLVVKESPSEVLRNVISAAVYGAEGIGVKLGARAFAFAAAATGVAMSTIDGITQAPLWEVPRWHSKDTRIQVHLISGRHISDGDGERANVYAELELWDPASSEPYKMVDKAISEMQMWTKTPNWDQHFELGPVRFARSTLRVKCKHRATMQVLNWEETPPKRLGEIVLCLSSILITDETIEDGAERISWFPLRNAGESKAGSKGELKLGLRLVNADGLPDLPIAI